MRLAPQRRAIFPRPNFKKCSEPPQFFNIFTYQCASRHSGVQFFDIRTSKSVRDRQFFSIFTYKCASRHSGMQFFDVKISKNGPNLLCFVHFDLQMCFSLQRRAIFPHPNFKKWSEAVVCFVHFDFKTRFGPQRRAIFHASSKQLPPHLPLYQPYFSTNRPTNHGKNTAFRDFPNISRVCISAFVRFSRNCIFFLLTLLLLSVFSSSDSATLLCFFNCPYCRKLNF